VTSSLKKRAASIVSLLSQRYPDAVCTLSHQSPWELLVGAILASQCTDERVNRITPALFQAFPHPQAMAEANLEDLESLIRTCGLFRAKAAALKGTASRVMEVHGGQVPSTAEELMDLPGVGRKITNLILGDAFGQQALVVDTHCGRISRLLGLTDSQNPLVIEKDLAKAVPEDSWTSWGHLMVAHGRELCRARCRLCFQCPLRLLCRYGMALDPAEEEEAGCV